MLNNIEQRFADYFKTKKRTGKVKWLNSIFKDIIFDYDWKKRGEITKDFVSEFLNKHGIENINHRLRQYKSDEKVSSEESHYLIIKKNDKKIAIKVASEGGKEGSNHFTFNQIRPKNNYDYLLLVYIFPDRLRFDCFKKWEEKELKLSPQHTKDRNVTDTFTYSVKKNHFMKFEEVVEILKSE